MTLLWKNRENEQHVFLDIDTCGLHTIHEILNIMLRNMIRN